MDKSNNRSNFSFISFLGGMTTGIVLVVGLMFLFMPSMMITVHESRFASVEETVSRLQEAISKNGWSSPMVRNMNEAMEKGGHPSSRTVRLVELCKAQYAKEVLETNPEVSTLMPCAWGVYTGNDGKVYISGMNMGLMGKLFGGNIAKIMGGSVAAEEHAMLNEVIKLP
ncbi:MAG: DUF302 domain-containing protein [Candidatus Riflebacteria bacterium]